MFKSKTVIYTCSVLIVLFMNANSAWAQIEGCTDPLASNYNPSALINDGSCSYPQTSVIPSLSMNLVNTLDEISGLMCWNNHIWAHNDSEDINLYSLDTISGNIIKSYPLKGTVNKDWEDISQDNDYIYIGDFGNNSSGSRTDLKILRINKNSVLSNNLIIDTINFSYSDQTDFSQAKENYTDFDCEALIVSDEFIYLFTKQWISKKTTLYSLPKTPGTHIAVKRSTLDVNGLVTGAVYCQSKKLIALCGYTNLSTPFIYLLYDFNNTDFFSGNKRKIDIELPFHQVEGISTTNGLKYYISNENISYLNILAKLHVINLNPYLEQYIIKPSSSVVNPRGTNHQYTVYPLPAHNFINIDTKGMDDKECYTLFSISGQTVLSGILSGEGERINISHLPSGIYFFKIGKDQRSFTTLIKI